MYIVLFYFEVLLYNAFLINNTSFLQFSLVCFLFFFSSLEWWTYPVIYTYRVLKTNRCTSSSCIGITKNYPHLHNKQALTKFKHIKKHKLDKYLMLACVYWRIFIFVSTLFIRCG